jgi:hypothetical protein
MKRQFLFALICAAFVLVAAPGLARAQGSERPPQQLWEQYPLEPTATPAGAASEPSPSRVVPDRVSDGLPTAAIIVLMLAAAGVGGLAALTASVGHRMPEQAPAETPVPGQHLRPAAEHAPRDATTGKRSAAERQRAAQAVAAEQRGADEQRAAAKQQAAAGRAAAKEQAAVKRLVTAEQRATAKKQAAARRAAAKQETAASKADSKRATAAQKAAAKQETAASKAGSSAAATAAAEPQAAQPVAGRASSKPVVSARPAPRQPAAARQRPGSRAPSRQPTQRDALRGRSMRADACRIELHEHAVKSHFYAIPFAGGPVIARSPPFKIGGSDRDPGPSAPEALTALVEALTAAGWQHAGTGRRPWDLMFQRSPDASASGAATG